MPPCRARRLGRQAPQRRSQRQHSPHASMALGSGSRTRFGVSSRGIGAPARDPVEAGRSGSLRSCWKCGASPHRCCPRGSSAVALAVGFQSRQGEARGLRTFESGRTHRHEGAGTGEIGACGGRVLFLREWSTRRRSEGRALGVGSVGIKDEMRTYRSVPRQYTIERRRALFVPVVCGQRGPSHRSVMASINRSIDRERESEEAATNH